MYDCIIVGAGPAGMGTALTLARSDYKVVIIDKKKRSEIGNKVCGDALDNFSPDFMLQKIGLELPKEDEISDRINKGTIATKNASVTRFAPGYTVDRHRYGQRLLNECEKLGIEIIDGARVLDLIIEDNYLRGVKYLKNKKKNKIRAKLIADCSGTHGAIRSRLPDNFSEGLPGKIPDRHIAASYREIIELKEDHDFPGEIVIIYDPEIPPPGYIWKFPKGDRIINVGTGWLKSEKIDGTMKDIFHEAISKHYSDYRVLTKGGGLIMMRPPLDCLTFNGGLVVGEAACMTDPLSAEGHGPALVSGYFAGKTIINALDTDKMAREDMWQYNTDIMKHFGIRNVISMITSKHLNRISGNEMDFALKRELITAEELDTVFEGGEIDMGIRTVLSKIKRAFPRLGILIKIKKLVDEIDKLTAIYERYPKDPDELTDWRIQRDKIIGDVL